jgi:hypothetical protein
MFRIVLGILVAAGIFTFGFKSFFVSNKPKKIDNTEYTKKNDLPAPQSKTTESPKSVKRQQQKELPSEIVVIAPEPPTASETSSPTTINAPVNTSAPKSKAAYSDLSFAIDINGQKNYFKDWDELKLAIDIYSKDPANNLVVILGFAADRITQHQTEDEFRAWISRVGDYIFARRLALIGDLKEVIRNSDLMRTSACDVHKRGCALFVSKSARWEVEIRGFEKHPAELKILVEKILQPALNNPETMSKCKSLQVTKIATCLKDIKKELTDNQNKLVNAFLKLCTWDDDMNSRGIADNLGAFLPLVSFEDLPNISKRERRLVKYKRYGFLNEFNGFVVLATLKDDPAPNKESARMIRTSAYEWIIGELRKWTNETDISTLLLRSLFVGHQNSDGQDDDEDL